ncbi:MAG: AI-2E family transporter, partial [Oscillospiraceae bacterium]|nr:AI-2E family transporter [Oscillospiraceae bacterium]
FVINVPMRGIEKHLFPKKTKLDKLRRPLALVLTLLAVVLVLAFVGFAVIPQLGETIKTLAVKIPDYMNTVSAYITDILAKYPNLQEQFMSINIDWEGIISSVSSWLFSGVESTIDVAGSVINGIVSAVIGFIFALYILLQKERLGRQARMIVYGILNEKTADKFFKVTEMSSTAFANFISGQCLEACVLGGLFAIAMAILRMPYITLVSVLIAFTALIPVVGAFIGCGVGAFLIFMQDPMQAVWFIVMFLVIQQIEGNLIYPKVVGDSVGLPAIWVLAVVTIGGKLMGVVGMLIMIPLSSVLYALFREYICVKLRSRSVRVQKMFFKKVTPVPVDDEPVQVEVTPVEEKAEVPVQPQQNSRSRNSRKKKR